MRSALRKLRKDRSLTLAQLAEKTGYALSTLSNLELGRFTASADLLQKLSIVLKVPVDELTAAANVSQESMGLREEALPYGARQERMDWMDLMLTAVEEEAKDRGIEFDRESFLQTVIGTAREKKQFDIARDAAAKLAEIFDEKHPVRRTSSEPAPDFDQSVAKALAENTPHAGEGSRPSGGAGESTAPYHQQPDRTDRTYSERRTSQGGARESRADEKGGGVHHKK